MLVLQQHLLLELLLELQLQSLLFEHVFLLQLLELLELLRV
tara:strand:- start:179 stop:301 length:123 start_codon:yes stop_codon:yes gene_type:complete